MRRRASFSPLDAFCTTGTSPTQRAERSCRPFPPPTRRRPGAADDADAVAGTLRLPAGHRLERGTLVSEIRVRYELVGPAGAPLIVVLGGISADCHVTSSRANPERGWWEPQVGNGGEPLDTRSFRVLSFDFLGGPGTGSEPAATEVAWPQVTTADQADVLAALLDDLGAQRTALLVGASYGGMVGLRFAARYPGRVGRLLVIGAAHRSHPMAVAWRSLQRRIVRLGLETGRETTALEIARGLAMTTYRSGPEFDARFGDRHRPGGPDGDPASPGGHSPVEQYLEARGRSFAARFDPAAFLRLSESLDLHAVDPARIRTPTTLVTVDTDVLVPPWLVDELAAGLAGPTTVRRLSSPRGHDAFLTDTEPVAALLRAEAEEVRR